MKVVKGLILVIVGVKLLSLLDRDVNAWASDFVSRHGIDLANTTVQSALDKLSGVGNTQLMQMSGAAFGYSCLLFTEGVGLWLQKRWAEFLTAIATGSFIPFEIYEIYDKFTWVRVAILILNLFVVWYLVTRLRDEKLDDLTTPVAKIAEDDPLIKICGITNLEDAKTSVALGADQLGFNFYTKSPRYLTPQTAKAIVEDLPEYIVKVGVFVNEPVERIIEIAKSVGLDALQLHGDEDEQYITRLRAQIDLDVIKVVRLRSHTAVHTQFYVSALLLDSYSKSERGGTGRTVDWDHAYQISIEWGSQTYLAGGLTHENVAEAIRTVRPYAVDVCSGVESSPGKKDPAKVAAFIKAAKEAI